MADLYKSKVWLQRRFLIDKMSIDEIAKLSSVDRRTILRYVTKFGLKR